MNAPSRVTQLAAIPRPAALMAMAAAALTVLLLATLHVLSPEFDPSRRVVSEYANGRYDWVLSLMFASWAISSWSLAVALWSQLKGIGGKVAVSFLVAAGVGEGMASFCDINHPWHNLAGMIGVLSLPMAAMGISLNLAGVDEWMRAKRVLLVTANLTWLTLLLMVIALFALVTRRRITPPGLEMIGWTNRAVVVAYCVWVATVAWQALKLRRAR
jgi:Protein of unknown function (DUF998)